MTKTISRTELSRIWADMLENDEVLNDRREYTPKDLMKMYRLDEDGAFILSLLIMGQTNPRAYSLSGHSPKRVLDMIQEAQHQGFDGWPESDKLVIQAFLVDITLALDVELSDMNEE